MTLFQEIRQIDYNSKASCIYGLISTFSFIFFLEVLTLLFNITNILSLEIQTIDLDYSNMKSLADSTVEKLENLKENENFRVILEKSSNLLMKIDPESSEIPPLKKRKRNDSGFINEDNYFIKYCKIIDVFVETITQRFESSNIDPISSIFKLITSKEEQDFSVLKNTLNLFLKYVDEKRLETELALWYPFKKNLNFELDECQIIQKAEKMRQLFLTPNVDKIFPNITILYRIYLSLPISNAHSERSFSTLRRLKTYLRSNISEQRLNDMAILNIESEEALKIDENKILEIFASKKNRKLKFY
ncbi:unnamed protein product [Brachionus calyciflorus]|uniref:HAT C-terminal dimerisation domain-containing protein n=1 Tax=Brachionus calyciflorus TaxID=104777 RepID=A0A814DLC9_9BILA|nr:unnamed protein product [Brachionus calyciflorus]